MSTAALTTIRCSPSSFVILSEIARDIIQPESCFSYYLDPQRPALLSMGSTASEKLEDIWMAIKIRARSPTTSSP